MTHLQKNILLVILLGVLYIILPIVLGMFIFWPLYAPAPESKVGMHSIYHLPTADIYIHTIYKKQKTSFITNKTIVNVYITSTPEISSDDSFLSTEFENFATYFNMAITKDTIYVSTDQHFPIEIHSRVYPMKIIEYEQTEEDTKNNIIENVCFVDGFLKDEQAPFTHHLPIMCILDGDTIL